MKGNAGIVLRAIEHGPKTPHAIAQHTGLHLTTVGAWLAYLLVRNQIHICGRLSGKGQRSLRITYGIPGRDDVAPFVPEPVVARIDRRTSQAQCLRISQEDVLGAIAAGPAHRYSIARALNVEHRAIYNHLANLLTLGKIQRLPRRRYDVEFAKKPLTFYVLAGAAVELPPADVPTFALQQPKARTIRKKAQGSGQFAGPCISRSFKWNRVDGSGAKF